MDLIETIKIYRVKNRLTQEELGRKVGFSMAYINLIESGKNKPSFKFLSALAREGVITTDEALEYASEIVKERLENETVKALLTAMK